MDFTEVLIASPLLLLMTSRYAGHHRPGIEIIG